jgi:HSP20 family protein
VSPFEGTIGSLMNNFFNDDLDGFFVKPSSRTFTPAVNVAENKDNFRLEFAVPGMDKGDFNIKVDRNLMTISAERKNEVKKDDEKFTVKEFSYSSFSRTFTLPETVDSSKISAEYTDGILKVNVPKKEEVKQKALEIKVS